MSIKRDGRNEWTALARIHFDRVLHEVRCVGIYEEHGMSTNGKTCIPDLEQAAENLRGAISMLVQYSKSNASSATSRKTGKIMETGQALEIVHGMATRLYKRHGELDPASSPAEAQDALDTVEDFIVNNFEDGAEDTPNQGNMRNGRLS